MKVGAPFQIGQIVRLKNGKQPQKVLAVRSDWRRELWAVKCVYLRSESYEKYHGLRQKWRWAADYVPFENETEEEEIMTKLYQTKDGKDFGTFLAKNSEGQIVLEMKGKKGKVEAFDPKEIEEVLPYTVAINRFTHPSGDDKGDTRHYEMEKGRLEKGDVLIQISNGSLWEVVAVDTKNRSPVKSANGFFKLTGERIITGGES